MIFGGVFSKLGDRRKARGKRYEFEALLCAIVLSMLAGANSLRKIEAFIDERLEQLNHLLGTNWRKAPSWVGIRRFLLEIDEKELESAVRAHAHALASPPVGRQFIAIDGKALRGSASRVLDMPARQLVSAFDHDDLIVLGHVEVSDKSNEIPAAQALIESMGIPGRVFTLDALHCQKNADAGLGKGRGLTGAGQGKPAGITCRVRRPGTPPYARAMRRSARQGPRPHRDTHSTHLQSAAGLAA